MLSHNILDEIQQPLESGVCQTKIVKLYNIVCNAKEYSLETMQQTKNYQLVYNKQVIDPAMLQTYPYGYERPTLEVIGMAELLTDL